MEPKLETQLSYELQEMYLENKEWSSDILFLEDEMRFFQQLFQKYLESPVKQDNAEQVAFINASLNSLQERRNHLKSILDKRKHVLEAMLRDEMRTITLTFIEEDTAIVNEIKALLAADKEVKQELFALIESLKSNTKDGGSSSTIESKRYPIL
ncbi:hypothetical protein WG904_11605 [Pedobacter sp. Du54]|uniref:hypothetical protein n=1 Tax=Pedobacter anseongensis TaxID=3133439 RepID=UPI0030AE3CBE